MARRQQRRITLLLAAALLTGAPPATMLLAGAAGCGDGDTGTDTGLSATVTVADGAADTDSDGVDSAAYVSDISDLATHADRLNSEYSGMADDYGAGVTDTAILIAAADDNRQEFVVIVERLQGMKPPPGLEEAHQQLISGFGKWARFYELQVQGLSDGDDALLAQARQMDGEAADEVNRAIEDINSRTD